MITWFAGFLRNQEEVMKQLKFARAALVGAGTSALVALALAAPAWGQARIFPQGTDCATIQSASNRLDCANQLDREMRGTTGLGSGVSPAPEQPGVNATPTPGGAGGIITPIIPPLSTPGTGTNGIPGSTTGDMNGTGATR
jgi:hypothetical protein